MAAPFAPTPLHSLTIRSLECGSYELTGALYVTLERQDSLTCAFAPDLEQFGQGDGVEEAIHQLGLAIETYYDRLRADENRLPPHLAGHLRTLRELLRERPGPDAGPRDGVGWE